MFFVNSIQSAKSELRREMKRLTAKLSMDQRATQSAAIYEQLLRLPELKDSSLILAFASLRDEPDLDALWQSSLTLALPRVNGHELQIWRVSSLADLNQGAFGIREPNPEKCTRLDPAEIDAVLVPGVAFDRQTRRRLGRGGGFYDRFLASAKGTRIGICFPHQLVDDVPVEEHDCGVDLVISGTDHAEQSE
ncbi:MAG: 5-formyltetrahydrofolate cyclo-ligase [Verrucomicrobiota bacterium]